MKYDFRLERSCNDEPALRLLHLEVAVDFLEGREDRVVTKYGSLVWNVYMSIIMEVKVENEVRRAHER